MGIWTSWRYDAGSSALQLKRSSVAGRSGSRQNDSQQQRRTAIHRGLHVTQLLADKEIRDSATRFAVSVLLAFLPQSESLVLFIPVALKRPYFHTILLSKATFVFVFC